MLRFNALQREPHQGSGVALPIWVADTASRVGARIRSPSPPPLRDARSADLCSPAAGPAFLEAIAPPLFCARHSGPPCIRPDPGPPVSTDRAFFAFCCTPQWHDGSLAGVDGVVQARSSSKGGGLFIDANPVMTGSVTRNPCGRLRSLLRVQGRGHGPLHG